MVSTGIDIEPDTGDEKTDARLRAAWVKFTKCASACGKQDLWSLQQQAQRSEMLAGEFLWVLVKTEDYARRGIPTAVMSVEPDRLSDTPFDGVQAGAYFDSGIEYDKYGKPIAYHIRDDADDGAIAPPRGGTLVAGSGGTKVGSAPISTGKRSGGRRYLAAEVIHGFDVQRPGQIRGEPRLAAILDTLRQESELVEAELTAAKVGAAHSIKIKSTTPLPSGQADTTLSPPTYDFSPGTVNLLAPGEDAEVMANPRPSQQIAPFRQMLRGDISGATGIPQRYIDRDTSRANYSSMRADMLDTQRVMTPQQMRFGRSAAEELYLKILPELATFAGLSVPSIGTMERDTLERCKIMPDGWSYVDPQKDVAAANLAIGSGLTTRQEEIQSRGRDPRQVDRQRFIETVEKAKSDVELIKKVQEACNASGVPGLTWSHILTLAGSATAPGAYLQASVQAPAATQVAGDEEADENNSTNKSNKPLTQEPEA
jgi:capsid protein